MVPLDHLLSATERAKDDAELREFRALLYEEPLNPEQTPGTPDARLLRTIANGDKEAFQAEVSELERRTINEHSEWCHNDALLFLLLLGREKFRVPTEMPTRILDARNRGANSLAQKINHVFGALSRREHGMEGELCFLKLPYLACLHELKLGSQDAQTAFRALLQPGAFTELSPFLQLLAARAYEIILFERKPTEIEQFAQIVEAVERLSEKFTIPQVARILGCLSVKSSIALWTVIVTVLSTLFGVGYKAWEWRGQTPAIHARPKTVEIEKVSDPAVASEGVLKLLAGTLGGVSVPPGQKRRTSVIVEASTFTEESGPFSIEAALNDRPVLEAFAFSVRKGGTGPEVTVWPLRREGTAVRSYLSKAQVGEHAGFVLLVEMEKDETFDQLSKKISLRCLD